MVRTYLPAGGQALEIKNLGYYKTCTIFSAYDISYVCDFLGYGFVASFFLGCNIDTELFFKFYYGWRRIIKLNKKVSEKQRNAQIEKRLRGLVAELAGVVNEIREEKTA